MTAYNVEIVTPIRELKLEGVSYLRCPGLDGSFGVMNDPVSYTHLTLPTKA